jgi:N-sulfoglucosamine sulfohydrolase
MCIPTRNHRNRLTACLSLSILTLLVANYATAAQPTASERPNILVCMADDASWPYCGAYGCTWVETPNFDRVAREGLLFNNAFTPNAKCAPSRSCWLTGRNPWQLKEACNHWCTFPLEFKTYTEALQELGYFVGETGKDWGPGVALDAAGNQRRLVGIPFEKRKLQPVAKHISNNDYSANFSDFLSAVPADKPWCFWYGSTEPHRPYEFGIGLRDGKRTPADIDQVPGYWPDNETVRTDMLDYAYELKTFDDHLGRMLAELESLGQLDNTLVVVTADNGMPFPRCKGQAYGPSNHLPLAIRWPRGIEQPGRAIDDYVSFIDLAPTFIEVAGATWSQSGMQDSPGHSLTNIFRSSQAGRIDAQRSHVLIGKERHDIGRPDDVGYPIRGIVEEGWLYVKNFEILRWPAGNPETGYLNCDGSPTKSEILSLKRAGGSAHTWELCFGLRPTEELYDLQADPYCLENLASEPTAQSRKSALAAKMLRELGLQADPRMSGNGAIFDRYPYADPSGRGFYERMLAGEKMNAGWVNASDFEKSE